MKDVSSVINIRGDFPIWIALLLLILPGDVYEFTSFHTYKSIPSLTYLWLNSPVSYIYVLVVPFLLIAKTRQLLSFAGFVFGIAMWDYFAGNSMAYSNAYYESYINLTLGVVLALGIVGYVGRDLERTLQIFELIILGNVILVLFGAMVGFGLDYNRFSTLRLNFTFMSSNETAFISGIGLLLAYRKKSWLKVLVYIVIIILTGSRGPVLFLLVAAMQHAIRANIRNIFNIFHRKYMIALSGVIVVGFFASIFFSSLRSLEFLSSLNSIGTEEISQDVSVLGRVQSINVGWQLMLNYPMGLSFCFNDVQWNMNIFGYPTFPHSCVMYWYLVMGPVMTMLLFVAYLRKISMDIILGVPLFFYVTSYLVFSGGATIGFKMIVFLALLINIKKDLK